MPCPERAEDTEGLKLTWNSLAVPSPSASSRVGEAGQCSHMHLYPARSGWQEQGKWDCLVLPSLSVFRHVSE